MSKKTSDKKLGRFSTILEIITNLGQIASWILGIGSAYILNIQKTPIAIPGIDITLDLGFQFALLISVMLGYIHFLQDYWEKNIEKQKLSDSFTDFCFWDLPRLRKPLLLIPIVIAFAIFIQVSIKSYWLLGIFLSILILLGYFVFQKFNYHLSPSRNHEKLMSEWRNSNEWFEKWSKRIKGQLTRNIGVRESDLYESGIRYSDEARLEILFALNLYFEKYEFEDDLILVTRSDLDTVHPYHSYVSNEWVLMPRQSLEVKKTIA